MSPTKEDALHNGEVLLNTQTHAQGHMSAIKFQEVAA